MEQFLIDNAERYNRLVAAFKPSASSTKGAGSAAASPEIDGMFVRTARGARAQAISHSVKISHSPLSRHRRGPYSSPKQSGERA
jgi:hypothetical protein